jgi:hypothetical protein
LPPFPTLEEALSWSSEFTFENSEIANETNDLANFPEAASSKNIEQN